MFSIDSLLEEHKIGKNNFYFVENFQISNYEKELEEMKHMTRQEYVASLRRYIFLFFFKH